MSDTPIWKKEIRLRKSRDEGASKTPPPAGEKKASIWKRELRLRKADPKTTETPVGTTTAGEEVAVTDAFEATATDADLDHGAEPAPAVFEPGVESEETAWEPSAWSTRPEVDEAPELPPADEPAAWLYPGAANDDEPAFEHEVDPSSDAVESELEPHTAFGGSAAWWQASEPETDLHEPETDLQDFARDEPVEPAENATGEPMVFPAFADSDPENEPGGERWTEPEPAAWEAPAFDSPDAAEPEQPSWEMSAPAPVDEEEAELSHDRADAFAAEPHSWQVEEPLSSETVSGDPVSDQLGYGYLGEDETVAGHEPPVEQDYPAYDPINYEPVAYGDDAAPAAHDPLPAPPEPELEDGAELDRFATPTEGFAEADVHTAEPTWSIPGSDQEQVDDPEPAPPVSPELGDSHSDAHQDEARVAAAGAVAMAVSPELLPGREESTPEGPKRSRLKRDLSFPSSRRRKPKEEAGSGLASADDSHGAKNVVGLRIGSSQLAAARIHNNGTAELLQVARTPLTRGIVSGGEVRDVESLTRALKAFFAEHKLPRRGVRLGIASNRIGVRLLEVPKVDDQKLFENSIRFHAQETLPIAVTDAILDHVVLGPGEGLGVEETVRVLLVFAHRELVDRHVEACRRAGVKLDGIDLEAFALLRALAEPRPADTEPTRALVAVAVGQERTIFAVSDGRVCDFTRVLEWGGGSLDVAIARALDLTPSQAEPIKLALSLEGDAAPSQLAPEKVEEARAAVRNELQALSRELVSSLQFYQARPGSLDIGEILLSGGGAQLAGFAAELEQLIGVPVRPADPFARVTLGRKVARPADAGSLAVAIGLAIED